jgi:hypothetical protein
MAAIVMTQMQVTAQDATTVTLLPTAVGAGSLNRDMASPITQIVLTMAARDTVVFDVVGRVFDIEIERR